MTASEPMTISLATNPKISAMVSSAVMPIGLKRGCSHAPTIPASVSALAGVAEGGRWVSNQTSTTPATMNLLARWIK